MDVVHPVPVAVVAFLAVTIVTTLACYGEAIRGIHEHLQGVPIEEDMSTLRFRIERVCMEMERQLALVQESQRHDRKNFKKLQELVTSQPGRHP
ncbi:hypothetical protein Tco_0699426 [Tanacetum coccineum]